MGSLIEKIFGILALSQRAETEFQTLAAGYLGDSASYLSTTRCLCSRPGESSDVRRPGWGKGTEE